MMNLKDSGAEEERNLLNMPIRGLAQHLNVKVKCSEKRNSQLQLYILI
jgi:hypothetical protein